MSIWHLYARFKELWLSKPVWDDLRVPVTATDVNGSNPPVLAFFRNDGTTNPGTSKALAFLSNSSGTATIPHDSSYDFTTPHTVEFWMRPKPASTAYNTILSKSGSFTFSYWGGNDIYVAYSGMGSTASSNSLNVGSWNHVLTRYTPGSPNTLNIFLNGTQVGTITSGGGPSDAGDILINSDTIIWDIDSLALWDKALSNSEIATRYNSGAGTPLEGTEVDLLGLWRFEESSGTNIPDSTTTNNNGTITGTEDTDFEWIEGHVGSPDAGSLGVLTRYFSPDINNEIYFVAQIPHSWKEGTDIYPHVHWVPPTDGGAGDKVRWGLEYVWKDVNEVFDTTSIVYAEDILLEENLAEGKHYVSSFESLDGTGKKLSSILVCRLFRDSTAVEDTYNDFAILLEIDFHYEINSLGSRLPFVK